MARLTRVTAIALPPAEPGANWLERTRDNMVRYLESAGEGRPDLVVFPETCNATGLPVEHWAEMAETIPGPTTDRLAEVAARLGTYLALPLLEREGDHLRNTVAFFDRGGRLLGKYHKHVPTIIELEMGVLPGTEVPVFTTDFGRIGAAICFDLNCTEVGQKLADNGARLVVWPSQYTGGERLRHWPRDYGFYLIACDVARSTIVDMAGSFLAWTGQEDDQVRWGHLPAVVSQVINMDRVLFHLAFNQDKFPEMLRKYPAGLEIENHYPEAHCTIASLLDDVTMEDIIAEFALEPWVDYIARCRQFRKDFLAERGIPDVPG
jgi:beta-ureidopropionase